jgi:cation:H+ antiporter
MRYIILLSLLSAVTLLSRFLVGAADSAVEPSYILLISGLVVGMMIILGGCELFANGVECFADRFSLSHATAGSLLAAVGTALPETMVPVLALLTGNAHQKEGIAVGAILGAPFMLSTLAMFLLGITVIVNKILGKRTRAVMNVNIRALRFEMKFFIIVMLIVLIVSILRISILNTITAIILLASYALFFYLSLKHEQEVGEEYTENFHFAIFLGCPRRIRWMVIQILTGLFFIIVGAHLFVDYISLVSIKSGIPTIVLSLLITPVATELPEKFNSITWTLKGKDTIGLANITGAMVFQSTIPLSIGLLFTAWSLRASEIFNIVSALSMAGIILLYTTFRRTLPAWILLIGGVFYIFYIIRIFT